MTSLRNELRETEAYFIPVFTQYDFLLILTCLVILQWTVKPRFIMMFRLKLRLNYLLTKNGKNIVQNKME